MDTGAMTWSRGRMVGWLSNVLAWLAGKIGLSPIQMKTAEWKTSPATRCCPSTAGLVDLPAENKICFSDRRVGFCLLGGKKKNIELNAQGAKHQSETMGAEQLTMTADVVSEAFQ